MIPVLIVTASGFTLLIACFGILFFKLLKGNGRSPAFSDDPQSIFSPERYREMERLLDIKLSFQPNASTFRLRTERVIVLRSYIDQLSRDFHSICAVLKVIMVNAQRDRLDLATTLIKQRLVFAFAIFALNCKLVMFRFGWSGAGTIRESLRQLSLQLRDLALIAQPEAVCC